MSVKRNVLRVAATTVASGLLATGALALASSASASTLPPGYSFTTLDNAHDPTFNQLLGINDEGTIAGYFGSGMPGHPNKGYVLLPPYGQGRLRQRELPRLRADPGHRPEQPRCHGRVLVQRQQGQR